MAVKCKELVYTPLNAVTFRITGGTKSLTAHKVGKVIQSLEGPDGIILSVNNTTEIKNIKYKVNLIEQIIVNKELNADHQSDFVDHHSEFFCNNANAALLKETWERFKFDENIVALEDIMLAKKIKDNNGTILYVPNSEVIHHHNENFLKIKNRYEREGLALNLIINQINFSFVDFLRLFFLNIIFDFKEAFKKKIFLKHFISILYFRLAMSLGIYLGNLRYKNKNNDFKQIYYFPK